MDKYPFYASLYHDISRYGSNSLSLKLHIHGEKCTFEEKQTFSHLSQSPIVIEWRSWEETDGKFQDWRLCEIKNESSNVWRAKNSIQVYSTTVNRIYEVNSNDPIAVFKALSTPLFKFLYYDQRSGDHVIKPVDPEYPRWCARLENSIFFAGNAKNTGEFMVMASTYLIGKGRYETLKKWIESGSTITDYTYSTPDKFWWWEFEQLATYPEVLNAQLEASRVEQDV
jgi:hypothetical protein